MKPAWDAWLDRMEHAHLEEQRSWPTTRDAPSGAAAIFPALRRAGRVAQLDSVELGAFLRMLQSLAENEDIPASLWAVAEPDALRRWRRGVYERLEAGSIWAIGIMDALAECHDTMVTLGAAPVVHAVVDTEQILLVRRRVVLAEWLMHARVIAARDAREDREWEAAWNTGGAEEVKTWARGVLERAQASEPVALALARSIDERDAAWEAVARDLPAGAMTLQLPAVLDVPAEPLWEAPAGSGPAAAPAGLPWTFIALAALAAAAALIGFVVVLLVR